MIAKARGPKAEPALAAVSFAESSFFPIPPDVMLIPMCLALPQRAFRFAFVCSAASVLGGLLGYGIGYFFYETAGRFLIGLYGLDDAFAAFRASFAEWGLWIILIKGLTPIPYKVITIASGLADFDLTVFILASIATRAARFYFEASLLWLYGPPIRVFIERNMVAATWIVLFAIVLGFLAARYVF
jgi:membrane protein YqaA with SNARE-associated domain